MTLYAVTNLRLGVGAGSFLAPLRQGLIDVGSGRTDKANQIGLIFGLRLRGSWNIVGRFFSSSKFNGNCF